MSFGGFQFLQSMNILAAASKMDAICLRALVLYYQYLRLCSAKQCSALFHKLATVLDELDCANDVFLTRAKMTLGGQLHYFSMGLDRLALDAPSLCGPIAALRVELRLTSDDR